MLKITQLACVLPASGSGSKIIGVNISTNVLQYGRKLQLRHDFKRTAVSST